MKTLLTKKTIYGIVKLIDYFDHPEGSCTMVIIYSTKKLTFCFRNSIGADRTSAESFYKNIGHSITLEIN